MSASPLQNNAIGAVFTPIRWAKWLVHKYGVASKWIQGATICDPTSGKGVFIFALMDIAEQEGLKIDDEALARLFVMERDGTFLEEFENLFLQRFGRAFPRENMIRTDVIINNPLRTFDFLIGNPPWANFNDLPALYKETLKVYFLDAGLVNDRRGLLLGSSRVDLAALVIYTVVNSNLRPNGHAAFFIPLSLLMNDGAHSGFRTYRTRECRFSVREVWDFNKTEVFPDILARYGAVYLQRDASPHYPISYHVNEEGKWSNKLAAPVGLSNAPLSVVDSVTDHEKLSAVNRILLREEQKPRQGVNTCGANDVFISDSFPDVPGEFVYPLITRFEFRSDCRAPTKFIVLPYDRSSGQPLSETVAKAHAPLWEFLMKHRDKLENRRGVMLNSWIRRGRWWALLGVGKYSFSPHKVVWEAYGKRDFTPTVFSSIDDQPWQANQALQAYIPCVSRSEADKLAERLRSSGIQQYLKSMKAEGTCNWAQPGRIKRFLKFTNPIIEQDLFAGRQSPA